MKEYIMNEVSQREENEPKDKLENPENDEKPGKIEKGAKAVSGGVPEIIEKKEMKGAREELKDAYEKAEQDSEDKNRKSQDSKTVKVEPVLTPKIISGWDDSKQKERINSIEGRTVDAVSNLSFSQEVRDGIAETKVSAIKEAFEKIGENLKEIKNIMDLGAGHGEILRNLMKLTEGDLAIGVDSNVVPSRKVKEDLDNLKWISGDAIEKIKQFKDGCVDLSTAFAFLQVLDRDEKIELLREMGRISEKIVIVDELKKGALNYLKKVALNKFYNAGMGKFEILEEEDWKDLFQAAGLVIKVFDKFGKDKSDFVAILEKARIVEK